MSFIEGTPDPEGSPNEKFHYPPLPRETEHRILSDLRLEGIPQELAQQLARAMAKQEQRVVFQQEDIKNTLEYWANRHTHPGGSGPPATQLSYEFVDPFYSPYYTDYHGLIYHPGKALVYHSGSNTATAFRRGMRTFDPWFEPFGHEDAWTEVWTTSGTTHERQYVRWDHSGEFLWAVDEPYSSLNRRRTYRYNTDTDAWGLADDRPGNITGGILTALPSGKLLYAGGGSTGYESPGTVYSLVYKYDPESGVWDTLDPLPAARTWQKWCWLNGTLYSIGGRSGSTSGDVDEPEVYEYDDATETWSYVEDINIAPSKGLNTFTVFGDKFYYLRESSGAYKVIEWAGPGSTAEEVATLPYPASANLEGAWTTIPGVGIMMMHGIVLGTERGRCDLLT